MKKIIMLGCDHVDILYSMLEDLKKVLNKDWEISISDQNAIHIADHVEQTYLERFLVLDMNMHSQMNLSAYVGYTVITIGFNSKASVTVSSVADDELVFCIQRDIVMQNYTFEPQEIVFKRDFFGEEDILNTIFTVTSMLLLVEKDIEKSILKTCLQE